MRAHAIISKPYHFPRRHSITQTKTRYDRKKKSETSKKEKKAKSWKDEKEGENKRDRSNGKRTERGGKNLMYNPHSLSSHSNSRRRRSDNVRRSRRDISIAGIALLTRHSTAAIEGVGSPSSQSNFGIAVSALQDSHTGLDRLGFAEAVTAPRRQLPKNASKASQLQRLTLPLATRGTGTVEGAQSGIDSASVGLGT
jgi:hypothetical protein